MPGWGATLNLGSHPSFEDALAGMEPDSHGLTVLPFLAGERAPGWAGHARATIHGLSLATTPLEILRAGMEAVAYRLALVFELLRPMIPRDPQVVASGGALLHSPAWLQIVTDVLGRPVAVVRRGRGFRKRSRFTGLRGARRYSQIGRGASIHRLDL